MHRRAQSPANRDLQTALVSFVAISHGMDFRPQPDSWSHNPNACGITSAGIPTAIAPTGSAAFGSCRLTEGGSDSFVSGLIYGLLTTGEAQQSMDYGASHGTLAMTLPGDTSIAGKGEVEKFMQGGGARVQR